MFIFNLIYTLKFIDDVRKLKLVIQNQIFL